jgi:hypothetical protein
VNDVRRGSIRPFWLASASLSIAACVVPLAAASAQHGCPTPWPQEWVLKDHVADAVNSHDFSEARTRLGMPTLDSDTTRAIITDAAICNAIYKGVYDNLSSLWSLPAGADRTAALATQSIHYFRVGDCYAAEIMSAPNGQFVLNGWADLMRFDSRTLSFIGVLRN